MIKLIYVVEKPHLIFRHYGSRNFSKVKFKKVRNWQLPKPLGGLWGSPVDSDNSWINFCEKENNIFIYDKNDYFDFSIKENAKILVIREETDCLGLPKIEGPVGGLTEKMWKEILDIYGREYLDYEKLMQSGIDAIIYEINDFVNEKFPAIDVDSICVLNPDVVEQKNTKQK